MVEKRLTEDDLVALLMSKAEKAGDPFKSKAAAKRILNDVFDVIKDEITAGTTVYKAGFGKFYVKERLTHIGRNPSTGESMTIPTIKSVHFKAGKELKDMVNGKKR